MNTMNTVQFTLLMPINTVSSWRERGRKSGFLQAGNFQVVLPAGKIIVPFPAPGQDRTGRDRTSRVKCQCLASTKGVTERQVERAVADRLGIVISRFMSILQVSM